VTSRGEADPRFGKGFAEFRAGRFFEAHEEWESLWSESSGRDRLFLQALIQLAAACVHLTRGNPAPGIRLLFLADDKLERFGDACSALDVVSLRREIRQAAERVRRGEAPDDVARAVRL
jgi:predicted metal-dependent hydrolase